MYKKLHKKYINKINNLIGGASHFIEISINKILLQMHMVNAINAYLQQRNLPKFLPKGFKQDPNQPIGGLSRLNNVMSADESQLPPIKVKAITSEYYQIMDGRHRLVRMLIQGILANDQSIMDGTATIIVELVQ
jgi:hypothetical protein